MIQSLLVNPSAMEAGLEAAMIARASVTDVQRAAFERYAALGCPRAVSKDGSGAISTRLFASLK